MSTPKHKHTRRVVRLGGHHKFSLRPHLPGRLERLAHQYLATRHEQARLVLTKETMVREQANLVVRKTVLRSMGIGCLGTFCFIQIYGAFPSVWELPSWFWSLVLSVLLTIFEVVLLHRLHLAASLSLSSLLPSTEIESFRSVSLLETLARAALELPEPLFRVEGLDPRRESSRLFLFFVVLVYKLKRALTVFVFRFLLIRVLPKNISRVISPWVVMPIGIFWNAIVSYRVLRELRIRLLGPALIRTFMQMLTAKAQNPSEALSEALLRAVGAAIVSERRVHPNQILLMEQLSQYLPAMILEDIDRSDLFLQKLEVCTVEERHLVFGLLQFAMLLTGSLERKEINLLREAEAVMGEKHSLRTLRKTFERIRFGEELGEKELQTLF